MPGALAGATLALAVLTAAGGASAEELVALLVSQSDTYVVTKGIKSAELPDGVRAELFTPERLAGDGEADERLRGAEVIVVDVMVRELVDHLLENVPLEGKRILAVRGSRDDARLAGAGIVFDDAIMEYFDHFSSDNVASLIERVVQRKLDDSVSYDPVRELPSLGVHHPDAPRDFEDADEYVRWCSGREGFDPDAPWIGVMTYSTAVIEGHVEMLDRAVRRLEREGYNVLAAFGRSERILERLLVDAEGDSRVDLVLACSLKFRSALDEAVREAVRRLDVPVINAIVTYYSSVPEWRESPRGLAGMEVAWAVANPELTGLIEPSVIGGKVESEDHSTGNRVFVTRMVRDNFEHLLGRIRGWLRLARKPNAEKKIAILFYNNTPGKQSIGASYLNVFASLETILARLEAEGYAVGSREDLDAETIRDLIVRSARNVGSWAPGELEEMVAAGHVARLPLERYQAWFDELPDEYRDGVREQWGSAADSEVMISEERVLIPAIELGNLVLMPEPSRGYSDDPLKLYHSPTLFPHHQYTAAYLWLDEVFDADARIHLGTHGTHEWLPGKQAGLSTSCPPEVLGTDTPSLYPYIVDDVGEGIQAKRRGRAVVIDHLVPPLVRSGLYAEYRTLKQKIGQARAAASLDAETARLKLAGVERLAAELGVLKDLGLESVAPGDLVDLESYLAEIGADFLPYGLHTFGRSPRGDALEETVAAIREQNPDAPRGELISGLEISGEREIERLVAGLEGRFVPAGRGHDPLRNPGAIPTGKNFYGFDPDRIPSREAFALGRRAAEKMLAQRRGPDGEPPSKVALVLWATETIRNEGMNESTALWLMGMRPTWGAGDRVTGVEVVPGAELGRPRIDVLINPSGLYRDLFPNMIRLLDEAVQKAARQTDVENLIAANSTRIRERLIERGTAPERAETLARMRIFSERPGNYGNRVVEVTGASGLWESDTEISRVYERHTGYAYGAGEWGVPARELLGDNLSEVDVAVHSISSALYGTMDNDDMFQFLGGLSLAVRNRAGEAPDTVISLQRRAEEIEIESIARTVGRELRSRYLNPAWIEGMKAEDYAGAREMSNFVDYLWGWQVTVPDAVDDARWDQTYEVYVEDKYELGVEQFLDESNPWALQSIAARMLESARKEYWSASEEQKQRLAVEYVESVLEHGLSCSDNTCDNPLLHSEIIEIAKPLLDAETLERFRAAIEKAIQKTLEQQTAELEQLRKELIEGFERESMPARVDGYEMEKIEREPIVDRGPLGNALWWAALLAAAVIAIFLIGATTTRR